MLEQKNKYNQLVRMNLQHFADPEPADDNPADPVDLKDDNPTDPEPADPEKTYTEAELQQKIKERLSREKKKLEAEKAEAKRLAQMNEKDRAEAEKKALEEKIAEYERKETLNEMSAEATNMLSNAELPYSKELISLVTNEDADVTKRNVQAILDFASKLKKENARQDTPNEGQQFNGDVKNKKTKAQIAQEKRLIK